MKLTPVKTRVTLDFKLKQASIDQATAGVEQGRLAVDQGSVVMIFTLVTIIFVSIFHSSNSQYYARTVLIKLDLSIVAYVFPYISLRS